MGRHYLTASRGDEGESRTGDGMVFHGPQEVFQAFAEKKLGTHAKIRVRLPIDKKVVAETKLDGKTSAEYVDRHPSGLVKTTVGRAIFNDVLHAKMPYYDLPLTTKNLSRIIADCYQHLGRRATIDLLDKMKETGFRESTRSGLSFATDDLRTPTQKEQVLKEKEREVEKFRKQFEAARDHREGAVQQGDRLVDRGPRHHQRSIDGGPEERPPRRQAVFESGSS